MTQQSFLTEIQAYYKPYNGTQKKYVSAWISKKTEKMLTLIFSETLKAFIPTTTTPTPGISVFEKAEAEVKAHRYPELMPKNEVKQIEERDADEPEVKNFFKELNAKLAFMARSKRV